MQEGGGAKGKLLHSRGNVKGFGATLRQAFVPIHTRGPARTPEEGMHWKGARYPPLPLQGPSLRPATVPLTPSTSLNDICN